MSRATRFLSTGIGLKLIAGLTGLMLVGFVVIHMIGNLTVFATVIPEDGSLPSGGILAYAHALHAIPGFIVVEIGLFAALLIHIAVVIRLVLSNRAARGDARYAVSATKRSTGKFGGLTARLMPYSGALMLIFLVVHLFQVSFQRSAIADAAAAGTGNLYTVLDGILSNPLFLALYIVGSILTSWHLYHGFQSAFRSLGLNHHKFTPFLVKASGAIAAVTAVGFVAIALSFIAR